MKNQISKLLIFLSKLAKTVRIFLASIQLAVYKNTRLRRTDHREKNKKKVAAIHEMMDYSNFMAP